MIQEESLLVVADNTGAKTAKVIRVNHGRYAEVGDVVKVAVQTASPDGAVKKKTVIEAVIIRTSFKQSRPDGTYVMTSDNACVLVDANHDPKGSRVFGPVFREVKAKGFQKIVSLAAEVV